MRILTAALEAMCHPLTLLRGILPSGCDFATAALPLKIPCSHPCSHEPPPPPPNAPRRPRHHLYTVDEVPPFLRAPYILTGYRCYLTYRECAYTLLQLSNEWVNVWTHLGGVVWAAATLLLTVCLWLPPTAVWDKLIFGAFLSLAGFCMLCSAGFHLFCCVSSPAFHAWIKLDYLGISVGVVGCYFPGLFYGFSCFPALQRTYSILTSLLLAFALGMQLHPDFGSTAWKRRRILTFGSILAFGVVPVLHWMALNHANPDEIQHFLPMVVVGYILISVGFAFYASRFPEVCSPGKFDIFGASHQLWHLFVLLGFMWWFHGSWRMYEFRNERPCPANLLAAAPS